MTRAAILVLFLAAPAVAQPGPPVPPAAAPLISPYLNLARNGNPAVNYFGIVRPQIQTQQQLGQLNQQVAQSMLTNQRPVETLVPPGDQPATTTGHAAVFNNTLSFFNRSATGSGQATTAARQPPAVRAGPAGRAAHR